MTQPEALLGLDVGTTATKAVLYDLSGAELATAEQGYPLHTPQPGWVEQDPEDVWQAVLQVLAAIAAQAQERYNIRGLALAAQCGSVIPADAQGDPVYPMITWLDGRSAALVQSWKAEGKEALVRRLSGWLLHPGLPFPSIGWLHRQRPHIFARARRFLNVHDFLCGRLAGRHFIDLSSAAEMQLVDVGTGAWSAELAAMVGITPDHLSELGPSGAVIGPLLPEICQSTGLAPGVMLVSGGHDQCCAALGMGILQPGEVKLACGTAWVITGVAASPDVQAIPADMDLNYHVVPERWTISRLLGGFGAWVEWWIQQGASLAPLAALPRSERFAQLDRLVSASPPGANGVLFAPQAGAFLGLRLDHTRGDMSRALLEGIGYEVRQALTALAEARGTGATRLLISGGATRSPVWPQILADIAGLPVCLADYGNWPALGAALLAGWGLGMFDSLEAGLARLGKPLRQIAPDPALGPAYASRFAAYQAAMQALPARPV